MKINGRVVHAFIDLETTTIDSASATNLRPNIDDVPGKYHWCNVTIYAL